MHHAKRRGPPSESSGPSKERSSRGRGCDCRMATRHIWLYALGIAIKSVSGQRGTTVNFATDSRVALDMLTKRRGGTAHRIHKELMRIEKEGSAVKLWWSSDQNSGIAEADRMAKRAREEPEEFPEEQAPITGRMLKKEATRAAKERWQTEWDQGEKGRMTHSIIREVDRKLRGTSGGST
jgi:hypothetical protein